MKTLGASAWVANATVFVHERAALVAFLLMDQSEYYLRGDAVFMRLWQTFATPVAGTELERLSQDRRVATMLALMVESGLIVPTDRPGNAVAAGLPWSQATLDKVEMPATEYAYATGPGGGDISDY